MFILKCWKCGKEKISEKRMATPFTCKRCERDFQEMKDNLYKAKFDLYLVDITNKLRTKYNDIEDYKIAFQKVKQDYEMFDSKDEILVALELHRIGIKAYYQVKFKKYRVDFMLPDLKLILEVDSALHKLKKEGKEIERDEFIKGLLPDNEWDIVRIEGNLLSKDIKRLGPWLKKKSKAKTLGNIISM